VDNNRVKSPEIEGETELELETEIMTSDTEELKSLKSEEEASLNDEIELTDNNAQKSPGFESEAALAQEEELMEIVVLKSLETDRKKRQNCRKIFLRNHLNLKPNLKAHWKRDSTRQSPSKIT
jgi:hypothetical protein